ncbi:MAG: hypothetical protein IJH34_10945, partial [Romboutsia sp.]|nr:hypothetical protein [Romboutsia sp.]
RNEIYEIPSKSEELYYKFKIEKWNKLSRKISIDNIGVRRPFYTSQDLINNSSKLQELFIKSKDEYRLFKELERFSDSNVINQIEADKNSFVIDNLKIELNENLFKVSVNGKNIDITKESFFTRPRKIIKRIMELNKG